MFTGIGDLLFWNLKTTHAGRGQYFKFLKRPVSKQVSRFLPKIFYSKCNEDRILVSGTFGLEGNHLDRYIKDLKTRKYMVNMWQDSSISDKKLKKMRAKQIKYYDMKKEILNDLSKGLIHCDKA